MRTRLLHPEFAKHETLGELSHTHRLLFAMLPMLADRLGLLEDRPRRIKAELFPYDPEGSIDIDRLLQHLHEHGFIVRYEVDDKRCIQIPGFKEWQKPHPRETASELPEPPATGKPRHAQGTPKANPGHTKETPRRPVSDLDPVSDPDPESKSLPAEEPPAAAGQSVLVPQSARPGPKKPKARRESKAKPGFSAVREHFESLSKARTGEDYRWSATASVGCNSLLVSLGEDAERCRRYLDGAFALADRQAASGDAFLASNLSMAYLGSSDGINRVRNALVAERAAKSSGPPRVNDGIPTAAESAARIRRQEEELAAARAKETPESKAKIQELIAATARSLGVRA